MMRTAAAHLLSLLLAGCLLSGPTGCTYRVDAEAARQAATAMLRTELYMGLARGGMSDVSEAEWSAFLEREVTPRFPQGFTVLEARGQWLQDGRVVREPSRVIVILHDFKQNADSDIEAIRAAYIRDFHQDAVLRVDDSVNARFR